jgi:hypothetical protein
LALVPKPVPQAVKGGSGIVEKGNNLNYNSNRRRSNRYRGPRVPQAVVNAAGETHMGLVTA